MQSSRWYVAALLIGAGLVGAGPVSRAADPPGGAGQDAHGGTSHAGPAPAGSEPHPEHAAQGRTLYRQLCAHCHGIRMVNPGNSSYDLRKFPHDDKARFVTSVMRGKNTMPAWGDMLKPDEIEVLWAYIRTGGKS